MVEKITITDPKNIQEWNEEMFTKHPTRSSYLHKNPIIRFIQYSKSKEIIKWANPRKDDRIIEVGCEEGCLLKEIPECKEVIGLDIARNALEKAKKNIDSDKVKLVCSDAAKMPFPSNYFDKVICSGTLEHVHNPEKVLDEIHRVCKDDCVCIMSVPYEKHVTKIKHFLGRIGLFNLIFRNLEPSTSEWHIQSFTPTSLKRLLRPNFKILKVKLTPFPFIGPITLIKCVKRSK